MNQLKKRLYIKPTLKFEPYTNKDLYKNNFYYNTTFRKKQKLIF